MHSYYDQKCSHIIKYISLFVNLENNFSNNDCDRMMLYPYEIANSILEKWKKKLNLIFEDYHFDLYTGILME
jgi:hypothetical protein